MISLAVSGDLLVGFGEVKWRRFLCKKKMDTMDFTRAVFLRGFLYGFCGDGCEEAFCGCALCCL